MKSRIHAAVLALLLAGCAGTKQVPPPPSPTPTEARHCLPDDSVISWSDISQEWQLLQVGVHSPDPGAPPDIVERKPAPPARIDGAALDPAWLPALVDDLDEAHQVRAATDDYQHGRLDGLDLQDPSPGRYVQYEGAIVVTARFSIGCDQAIHVGTLRSWHLHTYGALKCELMPSDAPPHAALARAYC